MSSYSVLEVVILIIASAILIGVFCTVGTFGILALLVLSKKKK